MNKKIISILIVLISLLAFPMMVFAEGNITVDSGDTTFIIISTALVLFMTPGLALFYGGMVRRKNVLNTMMNSFVLIGLISIQWVIFGYSLAFGPDKYGIIGSLDWLGLKGVGAIPNADYAGSIPHSIFMMYQLMFAIITPALITGAFAERMKFPAFIVFALLWSTFVYDPLAHMVWGVGGFLRNLGALDFAGGNVVHISSGVAGLVISIFIGKRKGLKTTPMLPHNIPFVLIGASILWFGWFGFNAGSALSASGIAASAFVNTNTSAAAAMISWIVIESILQGKPTLLGAATGSVVGLVAITPAAGFVTPIAAIIIGLVVSPLCYFGVSVLKSRFQYDDSLDAFGCHGIGGIWGSIATGLFATKAINPAGNDGVFYGNPSLLGIQLLSVIITILISAIITFTILKAISFFLPIRASESEEEDGMDISQHGEDAYSDYSSDESLAL